MITQERKDERVARAKAHAAADRLRAGFYSDTEDHSIGCSVGCDAIDIAGWQYSFDNPHAIVADHDGTPEWLEHLRDAVFEGLSETDRAWWHVALAESLPVGLDLDGARHVICIAILERCLGHRGTWDDSYGAEVEAAIKQTIEYHRNPTESAAWSAARSAAESAAESARSAAWSAARSAAESARSAARSAAWSAAWSAAESARSAARSAAWSAAESAAESARSAAWKGIANDVIAILTRWQDD